MKNWLWIIAIGCWLPLQAQQVTGIGTRWANDFSDWILYTDDPDEEGQLLLRWRNQGNWTEWDYRIGEHSGSIRQKWRNDPSQWELRADNEIITLRAVWPNDPREWRVTNNDVTLTIKTKYGNQADEWKVTEKNHGTFSLYTSIELDPRDWVVEDNLDDSISDPMRMALIFIAVFQSIPKQ